MKQPSFQYRIVCGALDQARSISVNRLFRILTGYRTASNLFDGLAKWIPAYFGLLPSLRKQDYDTIVQQLVAEGRIQVEDQVIHFVGPSQYGKHWIQQDHPLCLMTLGHRKLVQQSLYELLFWASSRQQGQKHYGPQSAILLVQDWLRKQLMKTKSILPLDQYAHFLSLELEAYLASLSTIEADLMVSNLGGLGVSPMTLTDVAGIYPDPHPQYLSWQRNGAFSNFFYHLLDQQEAYPHLHEAAISILQVFPGVSLSCLQTYRAFVKGMKRDQIGPWRGLKASTINEHLMELAILYGDPVLLAQEDPMALSLLETWLRTHSQATYKDFVAWKEEVNAEVSFYTYRVLQAILIHQERRGENGNGIRLSQVVRLS